MATIKERYANALFELSEEKGTVKEDMEQAMVVKELLENKDVNAFLMHPHVPDSEKYKLFENAFSNMLSKHLMGFLTLMVKKNRERLIVDVLSEYIVLSNRHLGKTIARVVSSYALTQAQVDSIRKVLSKQIDKEIVINSEVDPSVIGGFYILIDGRIFDGTVRSELNNMKERLKRGSY